jgi:hypothetical protein
MFSVCEHMVLSALQIAQPNPLKLNMAFIFPFCLDVSNFETFQGKLLSENHFCAHLQLLVFFHAVVPFMVCRQV